MWSFWLLLSLYITPAVCHYRYNAKRPVREHDYSTLLAFGFCTFLFATFAAVRLLVVLLSDMIGDDSLIFTMMILLIAAHVFLWLNFRRSRH